MVKTRIRSRTATQRKSNSYKANQEKMSNWTSKGRY